jgi:hypothetical protein
MTDDHIIQVSDPLSSRIGVGDDKFWAGNDNRARHHP